MIQLFIGGVRSGKSHAAEKQLITHLKEEKLLNPTYIATSVAMGRETQARIERHQKQRQSRFPHSLTTHELDYQQRDLLTILEQLNTPQHIVLIECLSTWVGWYLTVDDSLSQNIATFEQQQADFLSYLATAKCHVIIVTGEVGCGLIGETTLQRRYADILGELNQQVAELSQQVFLLTAGIKQRIK